jgi:hypothetical protein
MDNLPSFGNYFKEGGNMMVTAAAVDYDMWRMYGFKPAGNVTKPFFSDPKMQCAPYAAMLLTRERKNIIRGTISVVGNEYFQPGDVVYVEHMGLLFYVTEVRHEFSFSNFSTTLSLSYGHIPGDYIPNPIDVVGKVLYNNKIENNIINHRYENTMGEYNLGAIVMDFGLPDENKAISNLPASTIKVIKDIVYNSQYYINSGNRRGVELLPKVEIRMFKDSKTGKDSSKMKQLQDNLKKYADIIKNILTGNTRGPAIEGLKGLPALPVKSADGKDLINIVEVDLSDEKDKRSPSRKAINEAKNIYKSIPSFKQDYKKVVDSELKSDTTIPLNNKKAIKEGEEGKATSSYNEVDQIKIALLTHVLDVILTFEQKKQKKESKAAGQAAGQAAGRESRNANRGSS